MTDKAVIVGNANIGKTTLFNQLTKSSQRVGNWAGVTSDFFSAPLIDAPAIQLYDSPGVFSLHDDCGAADDLFTWLRENNPDYVLQVISIDHLKRDLCLTQQLLAANFALLLVLSGDEKSVNLEQFNQEIGAFFGVASAGFGQKKAIIDFLQQKPKALIERQQQAVYAQQMPTEQCLERERQLFQGESELDPGVLSLIEQRYTLADRLAGKIELIKKMPQQHFLDRRGMLLLSFVAIIFCLFAVTTGFAGIFSAVLHEVLELICVAIPQSMITDELWRLILLGAGNAVVLLGDFFPPLFTLYFLLRWMEESGYTARVAMRFDQMFRKMGLSGKTFLPLLMGLGCNVPAIAATRMLPEREKIKAAMMLPFMTCSARLTTYVAIIAVYCPGAGPWVLLSLYLMGFLVAFLTAFIAKKANITAANTPLVMAVPPLTFSLKVAYFKDAYRQAKVFVKQAAKVVIPGSIIVQVLLHVLQDNLQGLSSMLLWLFAPFDYGVQQMPALLGIISGLLAKEMVIATMQACVEFQSVTLFCLMVSWRLLYTSIK